MSTPTNDYELDRKQHAIIPIEIEEDGAPKNLSGATVWFYCLEEPTDEVHDGPDDAILTKDNDASGDVSITDAAAGEVEVSIDPSDYDALPRYVHPYEVWVMVGGKQDKVLEGSLRMDKPKGG